MEMSNIVAPDEADGGVELLVLVDSIRFDEAERTCDQSKLEGKMLLVFLGVYPWKMRPGARIRSRLSGIGSAWGPSFP